MTHQALNDLIDNNNFVEVFKVLDTQVIQDKAQYALLKAEYTAGLKGIALIDFGKRLKVFITPTSYNEHSIDLEKLQHDMLTKQLHLRGKALSVGEWVMLGLNHHKVKHYYEAIAAYANALAIKPDLHEAWYNLGLVYADGLKDYEQAIAAYQKAINIKPDKHEAWYNLGIVYNKRKDHEQAIAAYQKVINIKPYYHEAWYNLGSVYKTLEDYEQAIAAYQKAINIKPDKHEAWLWFGNCLL